MIEQAEPLPECSVCGKPVRRAVWAARGGRCTADAAWSDLAASIGPWQAADEAVRLREWNETAGRIRRAELRQAAERQRLRRLKARRRA